jgi:hypothetical protein
MVGSDRYEGFKSWMDHLSKRMKNPQYPGFEHVTFDVENTPREAGAGGTGISFTQLRNILKDPNATEQQQLSLWMQGFDGEKLGEAWVKKLMDTTKKNMGVQSSAIKEYIKRIEPLIKEATVEQKARLVKLLSEAKKKLAESQVNEYSVRNTKKFIQRAHDTEQGQAYGLQPYSSHPKAVANIGKKFFGTQFTPEAVKVALLHDVLEDTPYTPQQLAQKGFSKEIIQAVQLLTKNKNLSYADNIKNIINSGNKLAMMVKYSDNYMNYTGDKSHWDSERAEHSNKKYLASLNMLGDALGIKKHLGDEVSNEQSVAEGLAWSTLDEGMSMEDKMSVFEEFHTKGNLTESVDDDKKDYFVSLFNMSVPPLKGKKYIVVPLSLVGNRILPLETPSIAEFIAQSNDGLTFNTINGEKTYPSKTMRDLSIFNTFTFSSTGAYDKFRTALSLKFDISLPGIGKDKQQGVAEDTELDNTLSFAQRHYPNSPSKQQAFMKFVQRSLKHGKEDDEHQDQEIEQLQADVEELKNAIQTNVTESTDYLDEK